MDNKNKNFDPNKRLYRDETLEPNQPTVNVPDVSQQNITTKECDYCHRVINSGDICYNLAIGDSDLIFCSESCIQSYVREYTNIFNMNYGTN